MKVNHIVVTICFSLILLFASGADVNPLWVTLVGMGMPMGVLAFMKGDD